LRYAPEVELSPLERNPQTQAALDDLKRQLGPRPPLDPEDLGGLGGACGAADVVVVGRRVAAGI
jgi:hypothetical protein